MNAIDMRSLLLGQQKYHHHYANLEIKENYLVAFHLLIIKALYYYKMNLEIREGQPQINLESHRYSFYLRVHLSLVSWFCAVLSVGLCQSLVANFVRLASRYR